MLRYLNLLIICTCSVLCPAASVVAGSTKTHCGLERSFQLNFEHIEQIWQPKSQNENHLSRNIDCLQLATVRGDEFPVGIKLTVGPKWLVLQLKQLLFIKNIQIIGSDQTDQILTGSVKVFGALSLPLALNFEKPCHAQYSVVNHRSGGELPWILLSNEAQAPVKYILLNSTTNDGLSWEYVTITGNEPQLQLLSNRNFPYCSGLNETLNLALGDKVCFEMAENNCENKGDFTFFSSECFVHSLDGEITKVNKLFCHPMDLSRNCVFEFEASPSQHGGSLRCAVRTTDSSINQRVWQFERTLEMTVNPKNMSINAPPVWISGYAVNVTFELFNAYPVPKHRCWIEKNSAESTTRWNMTLLSTDIQSVQDSNGAATLLNAKYTYKVEPVSAMSGSLVHCEAVPSTGLRIKFRSQWLFRIPNVTEPCVTRLIFVDKNVNRSRYFEVGQTLLVSVKSEHCHTSQLPVAHQCHLLLAGREQMELAMVNQTKFSSVHELNLTKSLIGSNWRVKCRINQLARFPYPDVYSLKSDQPLIFDRGNISLEGFEAAANTQLVVVNMSVSRARPPISSVTCEPSYFVAGQLKENLKPKTAQRLPAIQDTLTHETLSKWTLSIRAQRFDKLSIVLLNCQFVQNKLNSLVASTKVLFSLPLNPDADAADIAAARSSFFAANRKTVDSNGANDWNLWTNSLLPLMMFFVALVGCIVVGAAVTVFIVKRHTAALVATTNRLAASYATEQQKCQQQTLELKQRSHQSTTMSNDCTYYDEPDENRYEEVSVSPPSSVSVVSQSADFASSSRATYINMNSNT